MLERGAVGRWSAVLLSVLIVITLAAVGRPAAAAVASPTSAAPDSEAGELLPEPGGEPLSDEEVAVAMAAASGEPVEVTSARTPWARVFARPDGLLERHGSVEPQAAQLPDGSWVDIDATLVDGTDGSVRPVATAVPVEFSGGGDGPIASIFDSGQSMSLWWPLGDLPTPQLAGDTAVYPQVLPDVDLRLTATATGFSHVLVVHTPKAAANPDLTELKFDVSGDVQLRLVDGGAIEAVNADGDAVFAAPAPVMWDSSGGHALDPAVAALLGDPELAIDATAPELSVMPVQVDGPVLTLSPDADILSDPETVFPVFIDPTWNGGLRNGEWTMAWSKYPTSSFWKNSTALSNGSTKGTAGVGRVRDCSGCSDYRIRSFFRMDVEPFRNTGYKVVDATFRIEQRWSWTCSPSSSARVWRTSIISSSNTWNNQPDWLSVQDTRPANRAYQSANGCSGPGNISFDVTPAVSSAVNSNHYSVTFGMRAIDEGTVYQWKRYWHDTATLIVVYDSVPATPTSVKPQDGCAGSCTSPATVRVSRPDLQAKVSNELGGSVTAEFQLRDHATGSIIATGTKTVSSGSIAVWSPPSMSNGKEYRFRVRAKNSNGITGAWSSYFRFTIDTSGPGTPTSVGVSSTGDCFPVSACSSPAMLNNRRPTFKATPQHKFGDRTDVVFEIHPAATTSVIASATLTSRVAGESQTWRPASDLPQETTMRLRVRSVNDTHGRSGSWSSWFTFTVDTRGPNTPTVSSSLYAHKDTGTWNGGVGQPGSFTFGPNGSGDVVTYQWRFNGGSVTSTNVTKGDSTTVSLTPPGDLEQLLEVRTIDHAGNISAWRAYPFYVRPQPADAGYWKFDEGSGGTAASSVSGGQTGTLRGGAGWAASGINPDDPPASGTAVSLDGTDDYVEMPPAVATNHAAGFTVSAWVNAERLTTYQTVVAQHGDETHAFRLYYRPDSNEWCFSTVESDTAGSGGVRACSTVVTPQTGVWTHLVGVYDRPAGKIRLWVNGGPNNGLPDIPGSMDEAGASDLWAATGSFTVGRIQGTSPGNYWPGRIDEVRAHQRVLEEFDVVHVFRSCLLAACPPVPEPEAVTLVGGWDFEETSGQTAEDVSGLNNPVTMTGGADWTAFGYGDSRAVSLDGSSGHLASDGPVLVTDRSFTVSAWANLAERHRWQTVLSQDGQYISMFRLEYGSSTDTWCFRMRHTDEPAAASGSACAATPQVGRWTHLVGVYDAAALQIRLYVDGQLVATQGYSQVPWQASGPFTVGRTLYTRTDGTVANDWFNGTIDLPRAYQGAMSDAMVAQLYAEQLASPALPPVLAGDWRMDDQAGVFVFDHTFFGNDGTLVGGASWPAAGEAYAGAYGVEFDGDSGKVPTFFTPVDTRESFSVSAWVRLDDDTLYRTAVSADGSAMSPFMLYYNAGQDAFCFTMWHADLAGSDYTMSCAEEPAARSQWTHLVGVFDKRERSVQLYVDGVLARTRTYAGLDPWSATGPFVIGRALHTSGDGSETRWWSGGIALVRAYHGAMDAAGVADLFQEQRDRRPTAVIESPSSGLTWAAGELFTFSGHGMDADGPLPETSLLWQLRSRDCEDRADPDCQVTVLQTWTGVPGGTFSGPNQGEPVYLELELTATNNAGSHSTVVELAPATVAIDLQSNPEGLELQVGQVVAETPFTVELVEGATVTIAAPEPQQLGDATYLFDGWAHGGDASQDVIVGGTTTAYTANYRLYDLMPQASIDTPSPQVIWSAGQEISFSGSAANTEGPLAAEQLSWSLRAEYCITEVECNLETLQTWQGVATGTFTAPDISYDSAVLVLELTAEVGPDLIDIETVTLQPALVQLTLATDPTGLTLTAGSTTATAPFPLTVVQGATVELSAPVTQDLNGQSYTFDSWQHDSMAGATHTITAPAVATTFTASYTFTPTSGGLNGTVFCVAALLIIPAEGASISVAGLSTTADSSGYWEINEVPDGDQMLHIATKSTSLCGQMAKDVPVTVTAGEVTTVNVTLP